MIKKIYKSGTWLDTQAKTLERKTIKKYGRSLTFSGISRKLTEGAIIEIYDGVLILNEEQYKKNKMATIAWLDATYGGTIKLPCLYCGTLVKFDITSSEANGIFNVFCPNKDCEDMYSITR